jgi:DNA replication and repair protein RecF
VSGPNGAGKTNLLEALHVGTQGFSPRTRADAQLVRLGAVAARVTLRGRNDERPFESDVRLAPREARRVRLNGSALASADELRSAFRTLVFTPDRLAVVKGGPSTRRAYVDRSLGRVLPGRAALPHEYVSAVVQRNAALRRVGLGLSSRDAVTPWTERVAVIGCALVEGRREIVELLSPRFADHAARLGVHAGSVVYEGDPPTVEALGERLDRDLERGATGLGPHLHDIRIAAAGRDLRSYGSQGEQRTAVLALVLAEADVIAERTGASPLVLLDDVLSELDAGRRRALAELIAGRGQTIVTATAAELLPLEPAQSLVVSPADVRAA